VCGKAVLNQVLEAAEDVRHAPKGDVMTSSVNSRELSAKSTTAILQLPRDNTPNPEPESGTEPDVDDVSVFKRIVRQTVFSDPVSTRGPGFLHIRREPNSDDFEELDPRKSRVTRLYSSHSLVLVVLIVDRVQGSGREEENKVLASREGVHDVMDRSRPKTTGTWWKPQRVTYKRHLFKRGLNQ